MRTIQEIKTSLLARIQNDIPEITNISDASVVGRLCDAFAVEAYITEQNCLLGIADIIKEADNAYVGTLSWYTRQAKLFQEGDELSLINDVWQYPIVDTTKQIVKLAAATYVNNTVYVKVATLDIDNKPVKLTSGQISSLNAYFEYKGGAGEVVLTTSRDADQLKMVMAVYVDSIKILSNGEDANVSGIYPVEDAVNTYLTSLNFDGEVYISDLIATIKNVNGVKNVVITECKAKNPDNGVYSEILNTSDKGYTTLSGYMVEDTAFKFRDTFTYL